MVILQLGCERVPAIVLYTSVDEPYATPILQEFQKQSGIKVRLVTDTEASKSVGLAERLRAEKGNPQCDVWWGNEPFHTINLAEERLLQPYESASAKEIDPMYRDPQNRWAGNGLRARVIATHDSEVKIIFPDALRAAHGDDPQPVTASFGGGLRRIHMVDLLADRYRGKIAMARPTAGTTGGHVSALYVLWGEQHADEYFAKLRANGIKLLGGNGPVAEAVGKGSVELGLTDNDDVAATQREGGHLNGFLPDQDSQGTLMIPTTVGMVTGTKQPEQAKKLIDHLLSAQVEQKLIEAKFSSWSVRKSNEVKAMQVDYREVARVLPTAVRRATEILEGREGATPSPFGRGPG